ncbi:MAG TPA: DUF1501 domain-containing protein [Bryobacteraceae bacterium]|nr:DUF1501 domain-containing protein [Bryobacteraceae bacterium]
MFPCGNVHRGGVNRREWLRRAGSGFGTLALAGLLKDRGLLAAGPAEAVNPLAPRRPHFTGKAKSVIWLYMEGGPSGFDTFDPKPELEKHHGQKPGQSIATFFGNPGPLMRSPFSFKQYGQSGTWVSDILPHTAKHVDDLALVKSCWAESPAHGPAMYQMNTGMIRAGFPSVGSWVTYGLGSENQSLPGYVVFPNSWGSKGGPQNWGAGFLPGAYQGTNFRPGGAPILNLEPPADLADGDQRKLIDLSSRLNRKHLEEHPGEPDLLARIQSFELAYRMQTEALEAVDINKEPQATREMYGLENETTRAFGQKCLMARRLVERGVRFVQVYCDNEWDAHGNLEKNHRERAAETDQGVGALLTDLKQRGLLDSTVVIWGGEFGRMPVSESGTGRDHNPYGFLVWMAGGGVKGGVSYGSTDEIGYKAADRPVSVHDLHATVLHLLGMDHKRLTYLHNGRMFRLTDVAGLAISDIIA